MVRIREAIAKYYVQAVLAVLIFAVGIWIGQNFDINLNSFGFGGKTNPSKPIISLSNRVTPANVSADFSQFWDVWDRLTKEHLNKKDIDQQKLLYGAISGMVNAVGDPYTVFLDPSQNKDFSANLNGSYEGVGLEIGSKDGKLTVIAPVDGTPAAKAGVAAGDIIAKIDGKDTSTMTIPDAVSLIRGKAGTSVSFTFLRGGKEIDLTLERSQITVKSVDFVDKGNGVALIKVSRFGDTTQDEWIAAINQFTSKGFKKLILDLRNDPGGRLDTAIYIANEFVGEKVSVVQEEDSSGARQQFTTDHAGRLQGIVPVVLINKGSASASEIVSGALRDLVKAPLVGETSFGKGTVQKVEDLNAGAGLHITIAKWLTPNGTWVHGKGLAPDYSVNLTQDQLTAGVDPQLDKALDLLK